MLASKDTNIAILYPRIAHYREDYFNQLSKYYKFDIYTYINEEENKKNNFSVSNIKTINLKSFTILKRLRLFNFLPFLQKKYKIIILIAEMQIIPTWIILLLSKLLGKKTILWGHGISMHSYIEEEKSLKPERVFYHKLANYVWLYTEKEKSIWSNYIDKENITSLNNTINIKKILEQEKLSKKILKEKYNIHSPITLIFCARFSLYERRADLLLKIIEKLDSEKFSFVIIGDGKFKPDFKKFPNVYDFGVVYDDNLKNELFNLSDLYIQPGWIGLSCNEALAYGKPILTFKRTKEIKQCVEYAYLNKNNSFLAEDFSQMIKFLNNLTESEIKKLQNGAKKYAEDNLKLETMVENSKNSLDKIFKKENIYEN